MPSADDPSTRRSLHRLVEHYTPNGVLGRLLFASGAGVATLLSLFVAVSGGGLLGAIGFVVGSIAMLTAGVLGLVVLWPVYLSLIGNVDSAADYPQSPRRTAAVADAADSPEAVLKRRYAAGEIDHEEFEARLDRVVSSRDDRQTRTDGESRDRVTEHAR
ncbi:SHOCT domain-containing protein [Halobaculum marinum]|uniref:SHOCT domain-containing protein n=1 Tax=Halobaculum marinum TaxID=3031996 RepID=A0ABD5WXP6_9EURY|nr:SHOCT domain-containing protein [Halobaculum sp. DT55]